LREPPIIKSAPLFNPKNIVLKNATTAFIKFNSRTRAKTSKNPAEKSPHTAFQQWKSNKKCLLALVDCLLSKKRLCILRFKKFNSRKTKTT